MKDKIRRKTNSTKTLYAGIDVYKKNYKIINKIV